MAALDPSLGRSRKQAGMGVARRRRRFCTSRRASHSRVGRRRSRSRPPRPLARDRFRLRHCRLFHRRPRTGAVGDDAPVRWRSGCRHPVPASRRRISSRSGRGRGGGRAGDRHYQARDHCPSRALRACLERRRRRIRRNAGGARALRPRRGAGRAHERAAARGKARTRAGLGPQGHRSGGRHFRRVQGEALSPARATAPWRL
jgi:hypothetical protein